MLSKITATAVVIACAPFAASAESLKPLRVGSTTDIDIIVLCSEFPLVTPESVSDFLTSRSVALPSLSIVDGTTFSDMKQLKDPQLTKVLLFAANATPSQKAADCVQRSVPFAQEVLELSAETWSVIGLRLDDPAHPQYFEGNRAARYMAPTSSFTRFRYFKEEGWTVAARARAGSKSETDLSGTLEPVFNLDPL